MHGDENDKGDYDNDVLAFSFSFHPMNMLMSIFSGGSGTCAGGGAGGIDCRMVAETSSGR